MAADASTGSRICLKGGGPLSPGSALRILAAPSTAGRKIATARPTIPSAGDLLPGLLFADFRHEYTTVEQLPVATLPRDMRETFRVLKPGGRLILIAEIYKGANTPAAKLAEKYASRTGLTLLSVDEHRALFTNAGYSDVQVIEEHDKGWICGIGRKPTANS